MKKISRKLFIWSPFAFMILYIFHFQKVNSSISQPPAGYVKDPVSNMTCARSGCHSSYPFFTSVRANITIGTTQSNQVALNGFQYNTGTTYIMNFSVINPTNRSGFEMSALTSTNANAGTFAVTNANNTTRQLSGGIYYIGHKNANSTSTWSFNWTSPATNVGNITFYTAVNKSNNNNNASGDSIFHQTFVVTPAPFSANAGNDVTICPGSATSLLATAVNGSGTNSYAWSPSTNLSCNTCANPTASPTSTTTYTVTITSGGQTASDAVTVNTFSTAAPNINTTGTTVCPSSSVTLSSSGFSSYLWSTGSNSSSTSVSNGGTYLLTATDANGCRTTNSIIVQQGQTPTAFISSSAQYLCGGNNVVLSVGSFSTYNWSNAATTPTISVSQAGNYSVTVINATGCSASASINIQANAPPAVNVTASGALSFCAGGSVTLMANAGTNYSYKWSTGATSSSVNVTQSGAYIVTVYNPCDSAVSQIQNVTVTPVPSAQATPSGPLLLCSGSSQTLLANSSGLSYQWLRDGNIIAGENIDSLIINTNGNYAVVTSNGTCSDTSQIVAVSTAGTGNASVNISSTKNQICPGDMIVLDAGTGFTTYNWLPGNSVNQTLQITNAGTYIVNVTANNGQCTSTGADTIVIGNAPPVSTPLLSYDSTICAGDTVTISVLPNIFTSYNWSDGTTISTLNNVTGNYSVTVSESGFCGTANATLNAEGIPLPDASFSNSNEVLTATTSNASYEWYFNNAPVLSDTSNTFTVTQSGNYALKVTQNGCSNISTPVQITYNSLPLLNNDVILSLYPNPVSNYLNLVLELNKACNLAITLGNLNGEMVLSKQLVHLTPGKNTLKEDLSDLPAGVYVMFLQSDAFNKTIKIIKQNQ